MKYRVHRLDVNRARDEDRLEQYLNILKGEVIAIIPNIVAGSTRFLLIVEREYKDNDGDPALMLKQTQNMKKRILIYILFLVLAVFILWVATLISEFFGLS